MLVGGEGICNFNDVIKTVLLLFIHYLTFDMDPRSAYADYSVHTREK